MMAETASLFQVLSVEIRPAAQRSQSKPKREPIRK